MFDIKLAEFQIQSNPAISNTQGKQPNIFLTQIKSKGNEKPFDIAGFVISRVGSGRVRPGTRIFVQTVK